MGTNEINVGSVQKTLLLPLWGRAVETQKSKPLLIDNLAVSIVESLDYDFTTIADNISALSRLSWVARSIYFDKEISTFLSKYPDATIVNIGCGLDTTFDRVDNGIATWYELDLPDVINLRKKFIRENERRIFIPDSVFNDSWYSLIKNKEDVFLLMAGVIYFFDEDKVKKLFKEFSDRFKKVSIVLDYSSKRGIDIANKQVIRDSGMDAEANLQWGIDNIYELEKWDKNIKIVNNMPMFKQHKKNYPVLKRIGMNISDFLKVMSLAHIEICGV